MAEEKEIIYTIPLRKEFLKAPYYDRTRRAVKAVRAYLIKHTKVKDVKLGKHLNEKLVSRGKKSPPHKIKVKVLKEENLVKAELVGFEFEKKEEKKKGLKERLKEKFAKKPEEKVEEIKEKREEEKKKVEESKKEEEKLEEKKIIEKESLKLPKKEYEKELEKKAPIKIDKEKAVMMGEEVIMRKTQKPKHERKK